ncbi:hypothetical protein B0H13DRAFT_1905779 [Mycena leptocephala]|nr:hypothetical protein B0H13DRAFT_1905779 [Mycena leptocephala]
MTWIARRNISLAPRKIHLWSFNDTTNSDKRIFGSDGNATMLSFAKSPELFASTCAELFARMLDTVPTGVQLTEFSGQVRFWNLTENPDRAVQLLWDDYVGGVHHVTLPTSQATVSNNGLTTFYPFIPADGASFLSLDAAAGITSIRFLDS